MLQTLTLRVSPEVAADNLRLSVYISTAHGIDVNRIRRIDIVKRSIDARQRQVMINLTVRVHLDTEHDDATIAVPEVYNPVAPDAPQAVVVGAGPAGLFAALRLIQEGIRPIVVERGKDVDSRRPDMARISREGVVDPDSNYCFGEGGAGAFSDGKLYTRSKKRGSVEKILQVLHQHGAKQDILVDAHPHIGSDKLPEVIKAIRQTIERCGGKVLFGHRVDSLMVADGKVTGVRAINLSQGKAQADQPGAKHRVTTEGTREADVAVKAGSAIEIDGPVILATGHSARDVYTMLHDSGIDIEAKGLAVGVRLEHPQQQIDRIFYHSPQGRGKYLPAAEYSLLTRVDGRAVYSFCMCPGGYIIPAASAPGQMVVNGMSPSNRGTRWANSGMVVEILPEDIPGDDPLRMMRYQQQIEQRFYDDGDGTQNAPAQRMTDFVDSRQSQTLPPSSYTAGLHPARVDRLLPPDVSKRLQQAFREFGRKYRGFLSADATVIGDETRTSSPVRIPRDSETLCHITMQGLYPCGEGAGYAGGIVSAAIDGDRCAAALARSCADYRL